ncbi:hypothetical protein [Oceanobacillus massiliensis]|nr:hypothetical protein [Oceanobacillus massiliensis]
MMGNMMDSNGVGMMGFGILGWVINIIVIGFTVYFATKLALKHYYDKK